MDKSGEVPIITVSLLNEMVQEILEANFPVVWVEGEVSNVVQAFSGHWYFSLKDAKSQVRCAMFKGQNQRVRCKIKEGLKVTVRARVSLYTSRGDYQLIVEEMTEDGIGDLQQAFLALKTKLLKEGLFDAQYKKAFPAFPKTIGVITSSKGAAIRDIMITLKRRYPLAILIIYPTLVQGKEAAKEVATAIDRANRHQKADVLLLARGGGSIEDLWAFNTEIVARAIFACSIPIATGIGHETDCTIADFVADLRAPTPTGAAEQVSPDGILLINTFINHQKQLFILIQRFLRQKNQPLDWLTSKLKHPKHQITAHIEKLKQLNNQLQQAMKHFLEQQKIKQHHLMHALHLLSPLTTLDRGYSITQQNGHIITDATTIDPLQPLQITLAKGTIMLSAMHDFPKNH